AASGSGGRSTCSECRRWWQGISTALSDPQVVDTLQRGAALAANHGMAVAAHQRIGDRLFALRTVQFLDFHNYFAGAIDCTVMVLVAASRVPVTVTFLAATFSGAFWSVNLYAVFVDASYRTSFPFIPLTHSTTHLGSGPMFMSLWFASSHMLSV